MKEHFSFVQPLLDEAEAQGVFPAAAVAVGVGNHPPYLASAGSADLNTRFDMASMTKLLGPTMLALRAVEDGVLTLADPISRFFDAPKDKADITLLQLMTHTGGFEPAFWLFEEIGDPAEAAACILRHPLAAAPDGTPRYSCMGYILLGKILEKVYGAPLDTLAQTRVFAPLGMANTGYRPSGGNIAPTEVDPSTGTAWQGVVHDENARFLNGVSGNAGVFSDIRDCHRFAAMLAAQGGCFLAPATLRRAIANHTPGRDVHRGLGFALGGTPGTFMGDLFPADAFGHTGFTGTSLVVDPGSGLYVALLANRVHPTRQNERIFRFRRVLHNRVYAAASKAGLI